MSADSGRVVVALTPGERACAARFFAALRTADTWDRIGSIRRCFADEHSALRKLEEALTGRPVPR